MTEPPVPVPPRSTESWLRYLLPLSWLHYVVVFSGFALFVVALMSNKIDRRQAKIEQQFHGIQEMQGRGADGAASDDLAMPQQRPLLITPRPLVFILCGVMLVALLTLCLRQRRRLVVSSGQD